MKRLIAAIAALSLLGSSVALAAPGRSNHNSRGNHSYSSPYRGGHNSGYGYGYRNRDNTGAIVGLGLLGLFAALASQQNRSYPADAYGYGPPVNYGPQPGYGGYDDAYGPAYGGGYYGR